MASITYRCMRMAHRFSGLIDANNPTKPQICPTCLQDFFAAQFAALPEDQSLKKWPLPTVGPST